MLTVWKKIKLACYHLLISTAEGEKLKHYTLCHFLEYLLVNWKLLYHSMVQHRLQVKHQDIICSLVIFKDTGRLDGFLLPVDGPPLAVSSLYARLSEPVAGVSLQ